MCFAERGTQDNSNLLTLQVKTALRGEEELPWEGWLGDERNRKLGALRVPIMAMLQRDPSLRPSMETTYNAITHIERSGTTQ